MSTTDDAKPAAVEGKVEITISVQIDIQLLADVIVTAFDPGLGGCGYWSELIVYKWTEGPLYTKAEIIATGDDADGDGKDAHYTVDIETIQRGITAILNGAPINPTIYGYVLEAIRDNDAGMIDSDAADAIVQIALFGEIVYG